MKIAFSEEESGYDKNRICEESDYFICPTVIHGNGIRKIVKVKTNMFSHLHMFICDGHTYLIFNDENDLSSKDVFEALRHSAAIKDPRGQLCEAKDKTDSTYGVSPDHDPFHDGYSYLWYCGESLQEANAI